MNHSDAFIRLARNAKLQIREIPIHEFTSIPMTERPLLIDVREDVDWNQGHAEGAIHLNYGVIDRRIHEIAPDPATPMVCYSEDGNRSALVAENLLQLGYTHVASLVDGFKGWQSAGESVVHPIPA